MSKKLRKYVALFTVLTLILAVLVVWMMRAVGAMQGNGRVVNYAGIVRGATQRLVKNELYGNPDDREIARLDDILLGLQTGRGTQKLTVLRDGDYLRNLGLLAAEWKNVKSAIYTARSNGTRQELYSISERYFALADETVSAAEKYADGTAKKVHTLEICITVNISAILLFLFVQIFSDVKSNRILHKIAYIDPNTSLPNKRSCEDKLRDPRPIQIGRNVCCIMFDLNDLKFTNDTLGHEEGDALISNFASLLRQYAPADMFIGRFGGDEFVGIQEKADRLEIERFLRVLREKVEGFSGASSRSRISYACGFAFSDDRRGCVMQDLMDAADRNMYADKARMKQNPGSAKPDGNGGDLC